MGRFSNCNFYNRCDILFCLKNREIQLKNISFSQKKKNSFKKKKKSAIEKSYRAIPKLIFIKSKKRVKKGRMQQSISILIVRAISNRIRACVCTHDVMKSVENGWVCSGQQFSRHCLHGRKFNSEVALFMNHVRGGGAKRRCTRTSCDDVYQILPQRLLERVCATVSRTTDEARLCFNARMIRICAHASPKNVIQGSGRACVPPIRVRELCHLIRAAFLKFFFYSPIG